MIKVGVIGFGARLKSLAADLYRYKLDVQITAVADPDREGAGQRLKEVGVDTSAVTFYEDYHRMMESESLNGVMIGTRCSLHTTIACEVFRYGVPVFLEKPVATTMEDLLRLKEAEERLAPRVVVSFPLRVSEIVELAKKIVDSGELGTIENVQAVNNVPYGGIYFHNWYRDDTETGGLFLQKATHDFDYINYLLGYMPQQVCAMEAKQIFKGDREDIRCEDCKDYLTCPESPFVMNHFKSDDPNGEQCCFSKKTGNHDSAAALIQYHTGMFVNYSQNFYARKSAAKRGARLLGYKGTLEFDWVADVLTVHHHGASHVDTYKFDTASMIHGGGDAALMYNFIQVMQGEAESKTPLSAGLQSVLMCLKARESAQTNQFIPIHW